MGMIWHYSWITFITMFKTIHRAYRIFNVDNKNPNIGAKDRSNLVDWSSLSSSKHALAEVPVDLVSDIVAASDSHIRMFNDWWERLKKRMKCRSDGSPDCHNNILAWGTWNSQDAGSTRPTCIGCSKCQVCDTFAGDECYVLSSTTYVLWLRVSCALSAAWGQVLLLLSSNE